MEIESHTTNELLKSLPKFELSYETSHHKKDSHIYDICLAVPFGKKTLCWFTCDDNGFNALFFDLNRDKKLGNCTKYIHDVRELALGTIVYGSMVNDLERNCRYFVIEDIFWYSGVSVVSYLTYEKWYLMDIIAETCKTMFQDYGIFFFMPFIWKSDSCDGVIPNDIKSEIQYNVHHLQYRSQKIRTPFYNMPVAKSIIYTKQQMSKKKLDLVDYKCKYQHDLQKPQYRQKTIFIVKADVRADVYHLYAYGKNKRHTYYGVGYVPNYLTSVRLNKVFRNIVENDNLDAIEESDDEDDFQNTEQDKYVDLNKEVAMFCSFSRKFKKWVILNPSPKDFRVVHIGRIVRDFV